MARKAEKVQDLRATARNGFRGFIDGVLVAVPCIHPLVDDLRVRRHCAFAAPTASGALDASMAWIGFSAGCSPDREGVGAWPMAAFS
jgi:hypothetical protein